MGYRYISATSRSPHPPHSHHFLSFFERCSHPAGPLLLAFCFRFDLLEHSHEYHYSPLSLLASSLASSPLPSLPFCSPHRHCHFLPTNWATETSAVWALAKWLDSAIIIAVGQNFHGIIISYITENFHRFNFRGKQVVYSGHAGWQYGWQLAGPRSTVCPRPPDLVAVLVE